MRFINQLFMGLLFGFLLGEVPKAMAQEDRPDIPYAKAVFHLYGMIHESVKNLSQAIETFAKETNEKNYLQVKEAWLKSRVIYTPSEVYRFYEGPIDNEKTGVETLINSWPLDEMFIDSTSFPGAKGIINNSAKYPVINEKLLVDLNTKGSEKNISTGFHAIEYLLWGPDRALDSAGKNSWTYFTDSKLGKRRLDYLKVTGTLLVKDIKLVMDAWDTASSEDNFGKTWAKNPLKTNLGMMLRGMIYLASEELGGQRMFAAVDEGDQEHEHSCFSDMTHMDIMGNFLGLRNVWNGEQSFPQYIPPHNEFFNISSVAKISFDNSLKAYALKQSPKTAEKIEGLFASLQTSINKIPIPFDQAIFKGKEPILESVNHLKELAAALDQFGVEQGLPAVLSAE